MLVLLLFVFVSTHHYETVIDFKKSNTFYRQIIYLYRNIIKQFIIRFLTPERERQRERERSKFVTPPSVGALGVHSAARRMATNLYRTMISVSFATKRTVLVWKLVNGTAAASGRRKFITVFVGLFGRLVPTFRRNILSPSTG